ncbi:M23 family metallopeptidase [Paramaledivibacter caminithermalis]|uniref:Murein DD-endopeptidase MepM and murein hydrolase activator NlpD, contain LysM domain n=1 Tax=Paramaledivibacter caminithermalis (strain DSM 15212 / CIP 107654 / DViRD3) TaxID=1121301 RepID=A0A1M6L3T4_PARC5|nr:M23 family metallopeptidase [Paramaledivibacter caminithermalis]SHJ65868.1 Murein DD-endopeptidase MepM and murein hydrolase activator NlpD, contain LysM domain [Paramaledivibacter caminithermalis DSM 15212]
MNFRKMFKKNNNSNRESKNKGLKVLLDKEGFYIIMFLCVCIVGTVAVWVAKSNVDRIAEDETPPNYKMNIVESETGDITQKEIENQTNDIIIIDEESEPDRASISKNEDIKENINQEEIDLDEKTEKNKGKILVEKQTPKLEAKANDVKETIVPSNAEAIRMIWPAQGELGMGYAVETLTYSATLDHYTTHHGIDILAEMNTPVKAVLAGEVVEVLTDSRLGMTISIDHGNGLLTRYSNLCTDLMVNLGDKVTKGQTISGVGTSSIFESAEGPHLHFEVLLNGENVDPMKYLAEE